MKYLDFSPPSLKWCAAAHPPFKIFLSKSMHWCLTAFLSVGVTSVPNAFAQTQVDDDATEEIEVTSVFRGTPIAPDRVQTMVTELTGLIEHYELTLASAGVWNPGPKQSMVALIDQLQTLEDAASQTESNHKISARYVGLVRALNQAKQHRNDFQSLIQVGDYNKASQTWVKAKNVLNDNFPTGLNHSSPDIRAIWLDRGTIVKAQSADDLKLLFDRMKRAGINVVFFETVNAGYPIYPSEVAPQQNPLTAGWDPLKAAVTLAHERDMELHAWVWVFSAANRRHNQILELPDSYSGPVLSKNPSWAIADRNGKQPEWISGKSFMDPANPEVRDYLSRLFNEIVTRYDVDGLQLDYIRYPFQNPHQGNIHGYSATARREFRQQYRLDPIKFTPGHPYWNAWLNFKTEQIDSFVEEMSVKLKAKRPNLTLSAAVFPMEYKIRHSNLQQNWQRWVKEGWVDLLVPMTYAPNTQEFQAITEPLFQADSQGASLLIPGLRLLNMPSYKTVQQVQYIQQSPTPGYALFAAAHFRAGLARTLNRPSFKSTAPILPHRTPLKAAAAEYLGLQREWHYWLENQVKISQPALVIDRLKPWAQSADEFSDMLSVLLETPDPKQLQVTHDALLQLRESAQGWMSDQALLPPRQFNRWNNRLQKIQMLLTYGEKHLPAANESLAISQVGE